jgi:colicin import membrane protein
MTASRLSRAWDGTKAFGLSVGVHLLAATLIVLGTMDWQPFRPPRLEGLSIEAVIVDTEALRQARREAEQAQQREVERERRQRELEDQRERERLEAEQRRREQLEQRREEDLRLQQLRAQQERDRQERLQKQQEELERIRQQRAEAERQRKLEEERLKQLEARRQVEAEAKRQAAEQEALRQQQARAAQEFRAGQLATLEQQYHLAIQAQVTQNWLRPPTAQPGLRCTLRIVQIPGGEVISANIVGRCNADEATRRSLVAAVERAGNLPYRGFEEVFEREIDFIFRYDGD